MNAQAEQIEQKPISERVSDAVLESEALTFQIEPTDSDDPKAVKEAAKQEKAARSHIAGLRRLKGDAERWKKEEKTDILERGRAIDSSYKSMEAQLNDAIEVHHAPIKAKEDAEKARLAEIDKRIEELQEMCAAEECITSEQIRDRKKLLDGMNLDPETLGERGDEARELLDAGLASLTQRLTRALQAEKDAAELEALRKEKADREAQEAADQKATDDAAEALANVARMDREKAEREAEIEAAKKQAREDAEREAQQKADAEAADEQARHDDEQNRNEVHKRIARQINYETSITEIQIHELIKAIVAGEIEDLTINY